MSYQIQATEAEKAAQRAKNEENAKILGMTYEDYVDYVAELLFAQLAGHVTVAEFTVDALTVYEY